MAKKRSGSNDVSAGHALFLAFITLIISFMLSLASEVSFRIVPVIVGIFLLLLVILTGILFDMIGMTSVTANERILHAKASQKVPGGKEAVELVKNSAKVASFCNDVIGDICGTLSGALGATIVLKILVNNPNINGVILGVAVTSMIASLTVGGKAYAKGLAVRKGTPIIFFIGKIINRLRRYVLFRF